MNKSARSLDLQQMGSLRGKRRLPSSANPGSTRKKITRTNASCTLSAALLRPVEPFPKKHFNIASITPPPLKAKDLQKTKVPDNSEFRERADPTTESSCNVGSKRSPQITINPSPCRYKVTFKGSDIPGDYQVFSMKENNEINFHLSKGRKSFWLKSESRGSYYLYDIETMQQHNIDTGHRRSIRFSKPEPVIDLTIEPCDLTRAKSSDTVCQIPLVSSNENDFLQRLTELQDRVQEQQRQNNTIDYCGPAFEGVWICGAIANRKFLEIRRLQLQESSLVNEMRRLPVNEQLFDPVPISPSDSRFPMEQVKHLGSGGLTVHEIRQTRRWKRTRSHFDLLLKEENDLFSMYKQNDTPLHLIHYGWHGAPAESIKGILECGFLSVPTARVGRCYGHGIYLATESNAQYSKRDRFSVPDAAGFKYLLLCEMLPGTVEVSTSGQIHPSSHLAHSGVDRMPDPQMHVFFTNDMNVRICPKFVVCILPKVTERILSQVQHE